MPKPPAQKEKTPRPKQHKAKPRFPDYSRRRRGSGFSDTDFVDLCSSGNEEEAKIRAAVREQEAKRWAAMREQEAKMRAAIAGKPQVGSILAIFDVVGANGAAGRGGFKALVGSHCHWCPGPCLCEARLPQEGHTAPSRQVPSGDGPGDASPYLELPASCPGLGVSSRPRRSPEEG